jgi:hypothetical protein
VRGASALDAWLKSDGSAVAAATVWEPVLDADAAPGAGRRVSHARNYWDGARTLSTALRRSGADAACVAAGDADVDVVWDALFAYGPDARWDGDVPPPPLACGRPIVRALAPVVARLR